jgi:hypothetical protein
MIPFQIVVIAGSAVQSGKLNDIPHNIEHEPFVVIAADKLSQVQDQQRVSHIKMRRLAL